MKKYDKQNRYRENYYSTNAMGYDFLTGNDPLLGKRVSYDKNSIVQFGADIINFDGRRDTLIKPMYSKETIYDEDTDEYKTYEYADKDWQSEASDDDTYIRSSNFALMSPMMNDNIYTKMRRRKDKRDVEYL